MYQILQACLGSPTSGPDHLQITDTEFLCLQYIYLSQHLDNLASLQEKV